MTILYTKLLTIPDHNILCDAFTLHGQPLQTNKRLLISLKQTIARISNTATDKIYRYEDNDHLFYIKVNKIIISIITDKNTTPNMVEAYCNLILNKLNTLDGGILKEEGDNFNVRNDYEEVDKELADTKKICVDNLSKMVQRGETINKLEEWGVKLKEASIGLNRSSRNMYYREKYKSYLVYLVIFIILVLLWFLYK